MPLSRHHLLTFFSTSKQHSAFTLMKSRWWLLMALLVSISLPWPLYPVLFETFCPLLEAAHVQAALCAGQGPPTLQGGLELALVFLGIYLFLVGVAAVRKRMPSGNTCLLMTAPSIVVAAAYTMLGNAIIEGVYEPLAGKLVAVCAIAQGAAPWFAWLIASAIVKSTKWKAK